MSTVSHYHQDSITNLLKTKAKPLQHTHPTAIAVLLGPASWTPSQVILYLSRTTDSRATSGFEPPTHMETRVSSDAKHLRGPFMSRVLHCPWPEMLKFLHSWAALATHGSHRHDRPVELQMVPIQGNGSPIKISSPWSGNRPPKI